MRILRKYFFYSIYLFFIAVASDKIKPYSGSHMVWNGLVPDFTMPQAQKIYADQHKEKHIDIGISGYKIDECDGYDNWLFPDHAKFPSGRNAAAVRSTLGILAQKTIYEEYKEQNKRTYGLVRASAAGSQMMPFCIYNDCYSFEQYLTGLASSSFCGALWVPEVRDADTAEGVVIVPDGVKFAGNGVALDRHGGFGGDELRRRRDRH